MTYCHPASISHPASMRGHVAIVTGAAQGVGQAFVDITTRDHARGAPSHAIRAPSHAARGRRRAGRE
ncbi:hypothetical protein ACOJVU_18585 [Mycobacterium sp. THU-M104]|uniref:hypothetical protein n=1 Tax=Mycobacterium sp. THU-M104 TaxID=3410515 RepID=UPI003B9C7E42